MTATTHALRPEQSALTPIAMLEAIYKRAEDDLENIQAVASAVDPSLIDELLCRDAERQRYAVMMSLARAILLTRPEAPEDVVYLLNRLQETIEAVDNDADDKGPAKVEAALSDAMMVAIENLLIVTPKMLGVWNEGGILGQRYNRRYFSPKWEG